MLLGRYWLDELHTRLVEGLGERLNTGRVDQKPRVGHRASITGRVVFHGTSDGPVRDRSLLSWKHDQTSCAVIANTRTSSGTTGYA